MSPGWRVWLFRALLFNLSLVAITAGNRFHEATILLQIPLDESTFLAVENSRKFAIATLGVVGLMLVHHIASVFHLRFQLAVFDCAATFLEVGFFIYFVVRKDFYAGNSAAVGVLVYLVPLLIFKITAMRASPEPFWKQELQFLGRDSTAYPQYTAGRILFNQSLTMPLLNGEPKPIIILRGVALGCLMLGAPIFLNYYFFLKPLQPNIFTRMVSLESGSEVMYTEPQNNAVIAIWDPLGFKTNITTQVTAFKNFTGDPIDCPTSNVVVTMPLAARNFQYPRNPTVAECPIAWREVLNLTISVVFPEDNPPPLIHVTPGQGDIHDILAYTDPLPVLPNSNLFAYLTWTFSRLVGSSWGVFLIPFTEARNLFYMDLAVLLPLGEQNTSTSNTSTIMLKVRYNRPTRYLEDYTEDSPFDGLAKIGGLWTSLNGVFSFLFGASVVYFLLGKRELSPLGFLHMFKHQQLLQSWHEQYPAISTEGGQPGSEKAGVVAFLRERFVNTEDDSDQEPVHEEMQPLRP
ncbi:hypothetical protein K438DRAFT_1960343 [Mycena galopus ATCC 62051]|nr:hypothetical protein K438DRAFT_1960343 [Mycena galopus ATCC 62051]